MTRLSCEHDSKRRARVESGSGLGFLVECPPARLLIAAGCSAGQSGEKAAGGLCQFWFLWVDALLVVFRRAKKICPLLCPRLILAYRQNSPADFGASIFFLTPSLIARSWRGTGVYPREDNPAVPVSLRLPIQSGISSRGLHAPGVSPPGFPVGFGV